MTIHNSSQTFSLLDQKACLFVVCTEKNIQKYNNTSYVQTLRRGFCLAGSISCPAASIHWLTAISSLSLMILMYSSAFWLPFWKFCSTKVMTILSKTLKIYNSPILLFIWEFSHLKLSCFYALISIIHVHQRVLKMSNKSRIKVVIIPLPLMFVNIALFYGYQMLIHVSMFK